MLVVWVLWEQGPCGTGGKALLVQGLATGFRTAYCNWTGGGEKLGGSKAEGKQVRSGALDHAQYLTLLCANQRCPLLFLSYRSGLMPPSGLMSSVALSPASVPGPFYGIDKGSDII